MAEIGVWGDRVWAGWTGISLSFCECGTGIAAEGHRAAIRGRGGEGVSRG